MSKRSGVPNDDTQPCVGCGMCCDGTLYDKATVAEGEEERLTEHGLTLTTVDDKTYFRLPCHFEKCGSCTIYETRFEICRSFRCALLKSYNDGEIDLNTAREKVTTAKALLATAVAEDSEAALTDDRRRLRNRLAERVGGDDDQDRGRSARQLLNIIALDTYLERWFRKKKSQVDTESEPRIEDSKSCRNTAVDSAIISPVR